MNSHSMLTALLATILGSTTSVCCADTRPPFTYHGTLSHAGEPANGKFDFEFALFADAVGGAELDAAEVPALTIARGVIAAPFSFGHANVRPGSQWIEVRVRRSGSDDPFVAIGSRSLLSANAGKVTKLVGPAGVGETYDVAFTPNLLLGSPLVVLASVNLPAGSYVAIARMQMQTGSESNPGNSYRPDCQLAPGMENTAYRVGQESNVERYLTWQGAVTLDSDGAIQFACRDGNGHTDTELSGKLTVMSVGSVAD